MMVAPLPARFRSGVDMSVVGVYRLQPSFAPRRIAEGTAGPADSLPVPLTSLVGRAADVIAVGDLLRREEVRLVTLTGPGGIGKTRLAIKVAESVAAEFPDGVWFVPLAQLRNPALVTQAIGRALGLDESGQRPVEEDLKRFLAGARSLLILDNFEQVVDAGPLVTDLLINCRDLKCLVTSRADLRLSGEHEFRVSLLPLPDPDAVTADRVGTAEAVQLLVERARAARPGFALTDANAADVAEVCRSLEGLPLAIELAAARLRHLSPGALLARLTGDRGQTGLQILTGGPRDAPARHRALHETIAWSYDLLAPEHQRLFRRLSVFSGGFTLDAAEALASEEAAPHSVLDDVASLIDKSLLFEETGRGEEPRFGMLEVIREFGLEQLEASGDARETRQRHAAWCTAFAERFTEAGIQTLAPEWLPRLEAEIDNVRAALAWLESQGDAEGFLQLAGAVGPAWIVLSRRAEGGDWLERAVAGAPAAPAARRARAYFALGRLADLRGDYVRAEPWLEESLRLCQEVGDERGTCRALVRLVTGALDRGATDAAHSLSEAALVTAERLADRYYLAVSYYERGRLAFATDDLPDAATYLARALALARDLGDSWVAAKCLNFLALVAAERGEIDPAAFYYRESLIAWHEAGIKTGLTDWLAGVGSFSAVVGSGEAAAILHGAAAALAERLSHAFPLPERGAYERALQQERAALGTARFETAWASGRTLPTDQVVALGLATLDAVPSGIASPRASSDDERGLTPRELDVLRLLVAGRSDREVGEALFISPRTASKHVASILAKLAVGTRGEAAVRAVRDGLV
jgi:predicted ATPase/DNA-binding CsgD family transcriptional regulator